MLERKALSPVSPVKKMTSTVLKKDSNENADTIPMPPEAKKPPSKALAAISGHVVSKFKHIKIDVDNKVKWIENLPVFSTSVPGNSDYFAMNTERCALPLHGTAGLILVLELSSNLGQRLPDVGLPTLENGANVLDLVFSPFDSRKLVVGAEDGVLRIWEIPENGIIESLTKPAAVVHGQFHDRLDNVRK
jgi:coronin-7